MTTSNYIRNVVAASHPDDLHTVDSIAISLDRVKNDSTAFDKIWNSLTQDFKLTLFIWCMTFPHLTELINKMTDKLNNEIK